MGFVFKEQYHARLDTTFKFSSFECLSVIIDVASFTFRFIIIYRVPPSKKNKIKKGAFITEFGDLIEQSSSLTGKLVILGDFNIHMELSDDGECRQLSALLDSFGLVQHVSGSTYVHGHTLDLVISLQHVHIFVY